MSEKKPQQKNYHIWQNLTGLQGYCTLWIVAPIPRKPFKSEKSFITIDQNGQISQLQPLPCWHDGYRRPKKLQAGRELTEQRAEIEEAEIYISVVVPAYNEEYRLEIMLAEAVEYLQRQYGDTVPNDAVPAGVQRRKSEKGNHLSSQKPSSATSKLQEPRGWEILIVSDGSVDKTVETALRFAQGLGESSNSIRVISLLENRGKGGAVTHGMRHVRGKFAIFADADGASKFEDLARLLHASESVKDASNRVVAVGSRAHLVGSEAVVKVDFHLPFGGPLFGFADQKCLKRTFLRNLLMHSFHLLLRLLTPPATASIRDTQCGFKLFSRPALPYIIPHMHSEGWIFDVELLMLAEAAKIPVVEVPIGWKEVTGSKLNVLWDSLGMAWGLAVLRAAWALGVYKRT